ncbi:OmpA family protein [Dyella solisilvae]|uniref:OmpA family protein n=2 Tax=Dyella solisilvae TaxID=1920168 RepID=A0A370K7A0_9GAMM|nr:OmpA family protein [Dyella solisilvae]
MAWLTELGYEAISYDTYDAARVEFPAGPWGIGQPSEVQSVEGEQTVIAYAAPPAAGIASVARQLDTRLSALGYRLDYRCDGASCGDNYDFAYVTSRPLRDAYAHRQGPSIDRILVASEDGLHYRLLKKTGESGGDMLSVTLTDHADRHVPVGVVLRITRKYREVASDEPAGASLAQQVVHFVSASAEVDEQADAALSGVAAWMKRHPRARIAIVGYSDAQGDERGNQVLSEQRAASVENMLKHTYAIAPDRLDTHGNGASSPIGDNAMESGRAQNRRVEFHELDIQSHPGSM